MEFEGWMLLNLPLVERQGEKGRSSVHFQYFGHLIVVYYLLVTRLDNPKN